MHILLTAATTFEIQPSIDLLAEKTAPPAPGPRPTGRPRLTGGLRRTNDISTLITGIGSMPTTWSLMRQIDSMRPDLIIQAGIAGCFTRRPHGQVVVVGEEVLADLGVWETHRFNSLFDLKLANADQFPFSDGRLVNPCKKLLALTGLDRVRAITVNEITTDPDRIRWHQQNTAAVVESMEGGGLHFVGLQEKIPFLQLRAISNDIGERDKTKWATRLAVNRLNQEVNALLEKLAVEDESILVS